jgi:hydroxypyruvate reductase
MTHPATSLRGHPFQSEITQIISASLHAVDPGNAVRRFVRCEGRKLWIDAQDYDLDDVEQLIVLGFGKATRSMARALLDILPPRTTRGLLIPKQTFPSPQPGIEVLAGGHPVPNENSLAAGTKALELVSGLTARDLLVCLISGGGSALMTSPPNGVRLEDLQSLTQALLACGARIDEINTLRRHLDRVKGGGIAATAVPARVASLILSDVVGNPLEAIASGPTAPDPSTKTDALNILQKYGLTEKFADTIVRFLKSVPETPKPHDALFTRVQNVLIGSNFLAAQAGLGQARALGFHTESLGDTWQGEARDVAKELCRQLERDLPRPFCLIAGGETTVTLRGQGRGGRNQEFALAAVRELDAMENVTLISLATDGEDGPTDAAGAVVMDGTLCRAMDLSLAPESFLDENDSYSFFDTLGDLIKTGPTGTNVNDLVFLFGF